MSDSNTVWMFWRVPCRLGRPESDGDNDGVCILYPLTTTIFVVLCIAAVLAAVKAQSPVAWYRQAGAPRGG